jgi:hypothetical protein
MWSCARRGKAYSAPTARHAVGILDTSAMTSAASNLFGVAVRVGPERPGGVSDAGWMAAEILTSVNRQKRCWLGFDRHNGKWELRIRTLKIIYREERRGGRVMGILRGTTG